MKNKLIILIASNVLICSCFYPTQQQLPLPMPTSTEIKNSALPDIPIINAVDNVIPTISPTPTVSVDSGSVNGGNSNTTNNNQTPQPTISQSTQTQQNNTGYSSGGEGGSSGGGGSSSGGSTSSGNTGSPYITGIVKEDVMTSSTPVPATINDQAHTSQDGAFISGKVKE